MIKSNAEALELSNRIHNIVGALYDVRNDLHKHHDGLSKSADRRAYNALYCMRTELGYVIANLDWGFDTPRGHDFQQ